jgi:uncharacterized protein (DUF58 family)
LLSALTNEGSQEKRQIDCLAQALQRADRGTPTGSLIFVIADLNREIAALEQTLGRMGQHHTLVLLPVDDPADREIPDMGPVDFISPDGEVVEIDTSDGQARQQYRKIWEQRRAILSLMANRLSIPLIPVPTNEDIHHALTQGLARYFWRR